MLSVALYRPEIPPNTGNIARLCAAARVPLHIVGRPAFRLDERAVRRAGLDYWPHVELHCHKDLAALREAIPLARFLYFTAREEKARGRCISYCDFRYEDDDCLIFGPESTGLPDDLTVGFPGPHLTIPMANPQVRSLNLATTVGIALYEALRQLGRPGGR